MKKPTERAGGKHGTEGKRTASGSEPSAPQPAPGSAKPKEKKEKTPTFTVPRGYRGKGSTPAERTLGVRVDDLGGSGSKGSGGGGDNSGFS